MPNSGGPKSSSRRLLSDVPISKLRYNAVIWAHVLVVRQNQRMVNRVHRLLAMSGLRLQHHLLLGERSPSDWDCSTKGRWSYTLIPDIAAWTGRKHGEMDFFMTKFLSGHGCFCWIEAISYPSNLLRLTPGNVNNCPTY
uniref:Uncharacterized protein n=1 Tax=Anopheles dirus TaxID=7168 RepID=A0A182N8J9_9DIPT